MRIDGTAIMTGCAAFVLALLTAIGLAKLSLPQSYPDFIVGSIAWYGGTKLQDLLVPPAFIIVFLLSFKLMRPWAHILVVKWWPILNVRAALEPLWRWIPALLASELGFAMGKILKQPVDLHLFFMLLLSVLLIFILSVYTQVKEKHLNPDLISLAVFMVLILSFLPLEAGLLLGRLGFSPSVLLNLHSVYVLYALGCILLLAALRFRFALFQDFLAFGLLLSQLGLMLWFTSLYPASFVSPAGIEQYPVSGWLVVLILSAIMAGIIDIGLRFYRFQKESQSVVALLSPVAMFGMVVAIATSQTALPFLPPDDYHFGEKLIGWWVMLTHGALPYINYIPPHGLVDDMPGFLSYLIYDGTAVTLSEANRLASALMAGALFLAIYRYSKSLMFSAYSAITLLYFYAPIGMFLCVLFMAVFLHPALLHWPTRWLTGWLVSAPALILLVPPQGLLAVGASSIVAAYMAWNIWQQKSYRKAWPVAFSGGVLLFLALLTPLDSMLYGAVEYVLENGAANQVAYGVPWQLSWKMEMPIEGGARTFMFEFVRMSWMVVPPIVILVLASYREKIDKVMLFPGIVSMLFLLLLTPYAMGRVDPGAVSRPGISSIFAWEVLLPLAVWLVISQKQKRLTAVLVALFGIALNFNSLSRFSMVNFSSAANAQLVVPPLRSTSNEGLPNIGRAYVDPMHWDRITKLKEVLDSKLNLGEPYLDLTNRNAQYFYMDRRPPTRVSAPYNMPTMHQQQRAISELSKNLPRIALLEGDNITHDGGGLALRNHALFRFVMDHYTPAFENGFVIGYRKGDVSPVSKQVKDNVQVSIPVKPLTDINWMNGVNRAEAAFVLNVPLAIYGVGAGDQVIMEDGQKRFIKRVAGDSIWLDGKKLNPQDFGAPHRVTVMAHPVDPEEKALILLDRAFAVSDLQHIPVSWGRSASTLHKKMKLIGSVGEPSGMQGLEVSGDTYKVVNDDPQLIYNLQNLDVSGKKAGILEFSFTCVNRKGDPRIQIFWWGDEENGPSEKASARFTGDDGIMIVPLDIYPRWLSMAKLRGLRIDLDNPDACKKIKIKELNLYQRID